MIMGPNMEAMYKATNTQPRCGKAHRGKCSGWAVRGSWGGITHEGSRWTPPNACFTMPTYSYRLHVQGIAPPNNTAEHASGPGVLWGQGSFGTQGATSHAIESTHAVSGQRQHLFCVEWRDHDRAPYRSDQDGPQFSA